MARIFSAPAQVEAYKNNGIFNGHEWGALSGNAHLSVAISLARANPSFLIVSTATEKDLINLKNGDISYHRYYDVDDNKKSWFTKLKNLSFGKQIYCRRSLNDSGR